MKLIFLILVEVLLIVLIPYFVGDFVCGNFQIREIWCGNCADMWMGGIFLLFIGITALTMIGAGIFGLYHFNKNLLEYGDGSDHLVCDECGFCKTCDDCICGLTTEEYREKLKKWKELNERTFENTKTRSC